MLSAFLKANAKDVGHSNYIQECFTNSGSQYNRALQDLVNYVGTFLGFEVEFGRYQGVQGQIGFDGRWKSPRDFHVVMETKTTDAYAIKTLTLIGYVNQLISEKIIPCWDNALGLYVVGRPDADLKQLENLIIAEKRTHELRVISVDSLLSLAEIRANYDVAHQDILDILRPTGPRVDPVVNLIARLVAESQEETPTVTRTEPAGSSHGEKVQPGPPVQTLQTGKVACWLTPVKSTDGGTAEDCIKRLVGKEHYYAFGDRTPGRRHMEADHRIAFYATTKGVIAHATLNSRPEKGRRPDGTDYGEFPWVCSLKDATLYLDRPVAIDAALRLQLDAFHGRDPEKGWAWFVQATRNVTSHDFDLLTHAQKKG